MDTLHAIDLFLAAKEAKGLSPSTLSVYRYRLAVFAKRYRRLPLDPEPIETFLATARWGDQSRDTYFRLLRNLYRFLIRRQRIQRSPIDAIETPRMRRKVARGLSPSDLSRVLAYREQTATRAFLHLLVDTGLRLGEALSVDDPAQIGQQTVKVDGKTGGREVPISPRVRAMVLDSIPWPWATSDAASDAVRRALRTCGVTWPRAGAQSLRHTFVRQWEGDESVLVGIMGWTSSRMLEVYRPFDLRRAIRQHQLYTPLAS